MEVNLSRANLYLVDDCDIVVAINEQQAMEWSKKEYGDAECGQSAHYIDGTSKFIIDEEKEVTNEQKISYLELNKGELVENHKPLVVDGDLIVIDKQFVFNAKRSLKKELELQTQGKLVFAVPFLLASTEY